MDYRKIGLGLQREGDNPTFRGAPVRVRELGQRPLGELGLAGLVERLALAIQRSERSH